METLSISVCSVTDNFVRFVAVVFRFGERIGRGRGGKIMNKSKLFKIVAGNKIVDKDKLKWKFLSRGIFPFGIFNKTIKFRITLLALVYCSRYKQNNQFA